MQYRTLKKLFAIFFVLFTFSSCNKDTIVPDPPSPPPPANENQISYAAEIQPIFTSRCLDCHGDGMKAPVLVEGKSYQNLMNMPGMIDTTTPANSTLYTEMKPGGGMSAFCTKANADSTLKWIRQGAKNN
jgi:hypothetical protein